jgi:chromosome segregation ATPase
LLQLFQLVFVQLSNYCVVYLQLNRRIREIQLRDQQLSQMSQEIASLQGQLEQANESITKLQASGDVCRQKYDSATQRAANVETEFARVQEQLNESRKQVC